MGLQPYIKTTPIPNIKSAVKINEYFILFNTPSKCYILFDNISKRYSNSAKILNKSPIKLAKPKSSFLNDALRHQPLSNSLNLLLIHLYTICTNNFLQAKSTFLIISIKHFFLQTI